MTRCYEDALKYEFDVNGKTVIRCGAHDRYWKEELIDKGKGRTLCPHFGGKCPAIVEQQKK